MVDVTGFRGEPWQVTRSHTGDGYVVHLIIAGVMIVLPALEAHKLGSALHAASGIDSEDPMSVWPHPDWHPDGRSDDAGHRDEEDARFWHCRCGQRYHIDYLICPFCNVRRADESSARGASASPSAESPGVPERGTSGTPSDFYVCPNHAASGGYDPSIMCGGWDEDAEQGQLCTEALEAGEARS